jgi:methylmalonyl-CoA mutase
MSEMDKGKKLFTEFPPVTTQQWEDKIVADLKGADYERKLVWRTNEGFNVRPYYRQENLDKLDYMNVMPGQFPFVRGNKTKNKWYIRQEIKEFDINKANIKAQELLTKGVNSLGFVLNNEQDYTSKDMAVLLKNIPLEQTEINFIAGYAALSVAKAFVAYLKEQAIELSKVNGSFSFDPLTCPLKNGKKNQTSPIEDAMALINIVAILPKFKAIVVRGDIFENAGSSIVQELGITLAVANEYLSKLTDKGLSADQAAQAIKFQMGVGSNYFMEIAKFRAARLLWAQIAKQYLVKTDTSALANIHAVTSNWNKTIYDPYVNMLRTQTEAMSSVLGGVDSLTVNAFNTAYEKPSAFSDRIARNQQILLQEEAHFDKAVDPGAGSYYIETLTDNIAEQAWKIFVQIEDKGGFTAAIEQGFVQMLVKEMAQKRNMDIANRKEIILGVNQYPNSNEQLKSDLSDELFNQPQILDFDIEPLTPYRGAMAFEALRYKTDLYSKNHKRPLAFMLTIGNLPMRKARAQFASNFFAVAGFEVMEGKGYCETADGICDAQNAKADIIIICSSDEEYATFAPQVKDQAGDAIVVIAGYPSEIMDNLKAAGLEHFIHVKSNVLETLTGFQKALGI